MNESYREDQAHPRVVSSTFPAARERVEHDGSRSRYEADGSMGRPPLTGQRINEKDREHQSAERSRHSRVRSGHQPPTTQSVRGDHQEKRSSVPDAANAS